MVLRFKYNSSTIYFKNRIEAIAHLTDESVYITTNKRYIFVACNGKKEFLEKLDKSVYNSLFFKGVEIVDRFEGQEIENIPSSVYLCPECIKEMLDKNSKRFYYPFTSCNSCSYQSSFVTEYPYNRKNSLLNFFTPCDSCKDDINNNPFRKNYPLISCIDCNIPIKLSNNNGTKVLFANKKDDYKKIFELLSGAILKNESVVIKTFRGYKRFYLEQKDNSRVLLFRPSESFLMLNQEKIAIFSIERPLMYVTNISGDIVEVGAVWDSFTTLLANELDKDFIYFDDQIDEYDLILDFDLPIKFYNPSRYFINKKFSFFRNDSSSLFPKYISNEKVKDVKYFKVVDNIVDINEQKNEIKPDDVILLTIEENGIKDDVIGVYFGDTIEFFYYKNNSLKNIFSFKVVRFNPTRKVVDKFKEKYPDRFDEFLNENNFLIKAMKLLGFNGCFEEFNRFSLTFGGKGGVSIDCRLIEDSFDYSSFYSSIMSFVLADTPTNLIAYSIFESLGDFLSNQAVLLIKKTKANFVVLNGIYIANSAFFSRFSRNIKDIILPIEYPIL